MCISPLSAPQNRHSLKVQFTECLSHTVHEAFLIFLMRGRCLSTFPPAHRLGKHSPGLHPWNRCEYTWGPSGLEVPGSCVLSFLDPKWAEPEAGAGYPQCHVGDTRGDHHNTRCCAACSFPGCRHWKDLQSPDPHPPGPEGQQGCLLPTV